MKETLGIGSAWAAVNGSISLSGRAGTERYVPSPTSSLLGTSSEDFFSSSRRAGLIFFVVLTIGFVFELGQKVINFTNNNINT